MDNEEITVDESLKSAFNEGYLLGKRRPETAEILRSGYIKEQGRDNTGAIAMLMEGMTEGIRDIEKKSEIEQGFEEIRKAKKGGEQEKDQSPEI